MNFFKSKITLFFLLSVALLMACNGDNEVKTSSETKPSNLSITADIVGKSAQFPNGDGSGKLNFIIKANNVLTYKILLGDGESKELADGNLTYTYTVSGTNTYTVYVSAYNGANFVSTSITVTIFVIGNTTSTQVWGDEFNINGAPDSSKWGYDLGAGGWGNNESQYYTNRPENVVVSNGTLKINTIKENYSGSNYTSARLLTKNKFSFKYGKIEFKAKLPVGGGTWPALWMLGDNISSVGWPACGEIDVMEHIGNQLNIIHGSLHSPGRSGNTPDTATKTISNASTEFHTYAIDWRANYIKFYIDDVLFYTFINNNTFPFNQNFFIIMNNAMGGNFGNVGGGIDQNLTSSTFEIDYVRVYK